MSAGVSNTALPSESAWTSSVPVAVVATLKNLRAHLVTEAGAQGHRVIETDVCLRGWATRGSDR